MLIFFFLVDTILKQLIAFEAPLHDITPVRFHRDNTYCAELIH